MASDWYIALPYEASQEAWTSSLTHFYMTTTQKFPAALQHTYPTVDRLGDKVVHDGGDGGVQHKRHLRWELLSCSQSQELSQCANLTPDWLHKSERPIRSRLCSLTQLLTMTTAQKFPSRSLVGN